MPGKNKKGVKKIKKDNVNQLIISAVHEGNFVKVKKWVQSHGLLCCKVGNGGNSLIFNAIKLGHIRIAKFLLQKGVKVECKSDKTDTLLHLAVEQKSLELVRLLLDEKVSVDARNAQNEAPLHLAAQGGYSQIVEALLNSNASLTAQNKEGSTPLFLAVEGMHEEVVGMLLKHARANLRTSARKGNSNLLNRILLSNARIRDKVNKLVGLILTGDDGHCKIVDELIDHGFILSREYVDEPLLSVAVQKNCILLIRQILTDDPNPFDGKRNLLSLHRAVKSGHTEIVELLLNSGFDANTRDEKGKTSLWYSLDCKEDRKCAGIIQLLLSNGASIEDAGRLFPTAAGKGLIGVCKLLIKIGVNINKRDERGGTPLFRASDCESQNKDEIVKLLLDNGADVGVRRDGMTAFHCAVHFGRKEAVAIFLNFGVNVDLPDRCNATPLHYASWSEYKEIVEILCENNANVEARDKYGDTPLHYAARRGSTDAMEVLVKLTDIDARGLANNTPLHRAFSEEKLYYNPGFLVVKILVNNGCDINAENSYGETGLDLALLIAESNGDLSLDPVVKIIVKYMIKLKTAGLHVSEKNLLGLQNLKNSLNLGESVSSKLATFQQKCEKEVGQMKKKKLNREMTLLDVLVNSKNPDFAGSESLMQGLQNVNFEKFPIYKSIIVNNLERSKLQFELKSAGRKWFGFLVKKSFELNGKECVALPLEILEFIVSHLSNHEIKCLIRCGEGLKCN